MHAAAEQKAVSGWLKRLGGWLLDLISPRRAVCMGCGSCLGCDRDDLCEDCRAQLARNWVGVRTMDKKRMLDGAAFAHSYAGPAGGMVRRLTQRLGISREMVCCVGDQANDLSMLQLAGHAFAPANAVEAVRQTPGIELLPDCREDAVAALIRKLDTIFSAGPEN